MPKCSLLVLVPLLSIIAWPAPPVAPIGPPTLEVRLYNYAEADNRIVDIARREVGRSYNEIGVSIRWVDCPIRAEDIPRFKDCTGDMPPLAVVIRLLPRGAKTPVKNAFETLGYALTGDHIRRPSIGGVLYGNVEDLGFSQRLDAPAVVRLLPFPRFVGLVVGRVMAHEISHLLGVRTHGQGLMEARLTPATIHQALIHRSGFSPMDAQAIRGEIARRGGQDPASISGGSGG